MKSNIDTTMKDVLTYGTGSASQGETSPEAEFENNLTKIINKASDQLIRADADHFESIVALMSPPPKIKPESLAPKQVRNQFAEAALAALTKAEKPAGKGIVDHRDMEGQAAIKGVQNSSVKFDQAADKVRSAETNPAKVAKAIKLFNLGKQLSGALSKLKTILNNRSETAILGSISIKNLNEIVEHLEMTTMSIGLAALQDRDPKKPLDLKFVRSLFITIADKGYDKEVKKFVEALSTADHLDVAKVVTHQVNDNSDSAVIRSMLLDLIISDFLPELTTRAAMQLLCGDLLKNHEAFDDKRMQHVLSEKRQVFKQETAVHKFEREPKGIEDRHRNELLALAEKANKAWYSPELETMLSDNKNNPHT